MEFFLVGTKIDWKKIQGWKKLCLLNDLLGKNLVRKDVVSIFWSETFLVERRNWAEFFFGVKQIFGAENLLISKHFCSEKNFGQNKNLVKKNCQKKILVKKKFGQKFFWSEFCFRKF